MFHRILKTSASHSFFLFGARGTGKSTYLNKQLKMKNPWILDLLDPSIEDFYAKVPKRLENEFLLKKKKPDWIIIDEVQKVPRLLDMVHRMIETYKVKFILTGSSARKLKRGSANLLAGRAFTYELFPLTHQELTDQFDLQNYLHWGGLPHIHNLSNISDKNKYLESYVLNYLNEEIRLEQIIRKLDPFRNFLEIAGQMSGKIINYKKIANEIGVDTKTIISYFQILQDTLLGFYLPAFHNSVRKSQRLSPKFYIFDTGVKKALENSLEQKPVPRTSVFGELFESMVILEFDRFNRYYNRHYKLSYFSTKNEAEIDLVLSKGKEIILIEIKSSQEIDENEVHKLSRLSKAFSPNTKNYYLSLNPHPQKIQNVQCLPWRLGIAQILKT
jgi:predicted AAA+ superfamily ATPase